MLKLMEEGYGTGKSIPQLIMAGASVDDVFVIVLFISFTGLASNGTFHALDFMKIPTSITLGLTGGMISGLLLTQIFKKIHIRDSLKVLMILSVSFLLVTLEHSITGVIGFSGLLAVMSMGLACGNIVLTVAVLSILVTAPLGAFAIDKTYKKLLKKD